MTTRDLKDRAQRHPEKQQRADAPVLRKPDWIRVKAPTSQGYRDTAKIMRENKLVTVCEEAGCPNVGECARIQPLSPRDAKRNGMPGTGCAPITGCSMVSRKFRATYCGCTYAFRACSTFAAGIPAASRVSSRAS